MYRRIISILVIVCVVASGCSVMRTGRSFEEAGKRLKKLSTYTCDVTMRITNNISTMEYKLKHSFKSPDKYRIEVLAPEELEGQVTIYNGSKAYIYHPQIGQYLITENFSNSVDYNAFLGSFMNHIRDADNLRISNEKIGEKEYIVVEFEIPEPNSYMRLEKIWIDAENTIPVKAMIYGNDGKTSVELYYDNFVCNPSLKDGDFEIIQKN